MAWGTVFDATHMNGSKQGIDVTHKNKSRAKEKIPSMDSKEAFACNSILQLRLQFFQLLDSLNSMLFSETYKLHFEGIKHHPYSTPDCVSYFDS